MYLAEIKNSINQLAPDDRAALARWIISNLDQMAEESDAVDIAWRQEIRERVGLICAGEAKMISSESMWQDILSNYGKTAD